MEVIGVDVSKDTLMVSMPGGAPYIIPNTKQEIKKMLRKARDGAVVAMEATGKYHKLLADTAFDKGFTVYVFNPKDVLYYAKSISPRAKTDKVDSGVIARYAADRAHRPYQKAPEFVENLKSLVRTRATLVRQMVTLKAQMTEHPQIKAHLKKALSSIEMSITRLESEIEVLGKEMPEYKLLLGIKGFGKVNAAYMAAFLSSGDFTSSDAFVAFIGLDLRVSDSGKRKGKRILSKRGDPEARRLLYLAAFSASQPDGPFKDLRLRHLVKGYSRTEAIIYVARKLARIAWAVFTKKEEYRQDRVINQLGSGATVEEESTLSDENNKIACMESIQAAECPQGTLQLGNISKQTRRKTA